MAFSPRRPVLSSEALEISGNFPETPDFPKIPEKCPEYLELLNLTAFWGFRSIRGFFWRLRDLTASS
jgi:hypothetical protein